MIAGESKFEEEFIDSQSGPAAQAGGAGLNPGGHLLASYLELAGSVLSSTVPVSSEAGFDASVIAFSLDGAKEDNGVVG